MVDPPPAKLRSAWDGTLGGASRIARQRRQRVERHDHDPLAAPAPASIARCERPLDLGGGEVEHARHTAAPRPRPADLRQAPRRLDRQLDLDRHRQRSLERASCGHSTRSGRCSSGLPPGALARARARERQLPLALVAAQLALAHARGGRGSSAPAPPRRGRTRSGAARSRRSRGTARSPCRPAARRPAIVSPCTAPGARRAGAGCVAVRSRSAACRRARAEASVRSCVYRHGLGGDGAQAAVQRRSADCSGEVTSFDRTISVLLAVDVGCPGTARRAYAEAGRCRGFEFVLGSAVVGAARACVRRGHRRRRRARSPRPSRARGSSRRSESSTRLAGPGARCPAVAVTRDPPASLCVPARLAISSADSGTTWRWAISTERLPSTCSSSLSRPGRTQVGELLCAEQQADPGRARAAEQPHHLLGGDRGELVDHDQRRHRAALQGRDRRLQVLHDRRAEHLR